ncbi:MAG: hypothetical protein H6R10_1981 [Rhodocyclaceae bacterium]|nr:hypothetical protein [Rhodocyclaceae bacterium]
MKHSLLVAALLALAVSACGKKEEAAAPAIPAAPAAEAAQAAPVAVAPAADSATANAGAGLKIDNVQAPAPLTTPAPSEQK